MFNIVTCLYSASIKKYSPPYHKQFLFLVFQKVSCFFTCVIGPVLTEPLGVPSPANSAPPDNSYSGYNYNAGGSEYFYGAPTLAPLVGNDLNYDNSGATYNAGSESPTIEFLYGAPTLAPLAGNDVNYDNSGATYNNVASGQYFEYFSVGNDVSGGLLPISDQNDGIGQQNDGIGHQNNGLGHQYEANSGGQDEDLYYVPASDQFSGHNFVPEVGYNNNEDDGGFVGLNHVQFAALPPSLPPPPEVESTVPPTSFFFPSNNSPPGEDF